MVLDLSDVREPYLDDFAVGAFNFDAGGGEGLSSFHAADYAANPFAVAGNDFNIVFSVERLQCS